MLAPVRAIRLLREAEERKRIKAIEQVFRRTELEARQIGEYDAADAMRQVADNVASGLVHRPPERGYVPSRGGR
jgi:hypothetical protein